MYRDLEALHGARLEGVPADLAARDARLDFLLELQRIDQARPEAEAIRAGLRNGRWRLTRGAYEFYAAEADRIPGVEGQGTPDGDRSAKLALAGVVAAASTVITPGPTSSLRRLERAGDVHILLLVRTAADGSVALALGLKNDLTLEGYAVEVARDGRAGAERALAGAFDLVVLDLMLPGKDGYTVCRELRRAGNRTPVLMLTARAQEAEKVLGFEVGADDYVTKPFSSLELRAWVKALLRRAAPAEADVYAFGDVEVDFTRGEVRRGGAAIEVTGLEFKLLQAFVRKRGRILTRDGLLDEVWKPDSCPTDRVIDNHIMNLRRKLEPDPQSPRFIVSVRGLGYRFEG